MRRPVLAAIQVALFLLPWFLRRPILNLIPGFRIHETARVGLSILLARQVGMDEGAVVGHLSFINQIDHLRMERHSKIGRSNWITGANAESRMFSSSDRTCELVLGEHARITGRHHIDCTGGVYIGRFTTIAGVSSQILTHSVVVSESRQVAGPVRIGDYCFVGTGCIILMGATLPDCSVLGAGAVLSKNFKDPYHLYAGNPARQVKKYDKERDRYFTRSHGHVE